MKNEACCSGIDAAQNSIEGGVSRGQWVVLSVTGSPASSFAYTVGLHHKGFPELIMVGLCSTLAAEIMSDCALRMIEQKEAFLHGTKVKEISNMPLMLIDVLEEQKHEYANQAFNHYQHWEFGLQQLVMSDAKGVFPWESQFDRRLKTTQRLLGAPPLYVMN